MIEIEAAKNKIKEEIQKHPVILYMKGSKLMPQCGFSAKVVHILNKLQVDYETRNVLDDDALRAAIKEFSDWPTIPQLYVNKEFIGGCDIVTELYQNKDLEALVKPYSRTCSSDT